MITQISFAESKTIWDTAYEKNNIHAPFFDWRWHNDWFTILAKDWKPYSLVVNNEIIAPFARHENKIIWSGGEEIADYLDLIGQDNKKTDAWDEILVFLKKNDVISSTLRNIPENSPTISFFQKLNSHNAIQEDTTPKIRLPDTWETYVESLTKKYRHELERKIRKFEREHIDAQVIESTDPKTDIHILLDLMEKDDDKKIFLTPPMKLFFQKIAGTFAGQISLRYIATGDKKIAATMGFITDTIYYLYNSGFDKECCANAGFYLKAINMKHAIENGMSEYNFLQGNERYKYELGAKNFFVYSIQLNLLNS